MKKIILTALLTLSLVGQLVPATVLAQEVYDYNYGGTTYDYNYGSTGTTYDSNYGGTTYDYNYGGGNTYDYNYGGTTYDYNYGSTGTTYDSNYGGTTYDYNYGTTGGTTYDYNYVTPATTYDYNYTTPAYTTAPSWTGYNYSTYSYPTQPTYTQPPVVTQPVVPVTTVTRCSDGTIPSPITGCTRTTVIPTNVNTICSDGQAPINGSCTRTIVAPVVTTQLCWDGSRISVNSICPAQYKVCANGTSIPVNQTCYVGNTYVPYVPPQTIKFNNVITSVATEITLTSARCNGIGLIASGAQSTGWFEYGETSNLGRETAKANIGSSPTAPFSNVLTNLKPRTTYYCRAVMQNQYGVVKGEIVAFTTKTTAVTYVKPIVKSPVTKTVTKTNQVLCVDGTYVTVGSKSASEIINNGQKLISLQIEKVSGNLTASSVVNYKLTLKNVSDSALTGVTAKVTIPQEIVLTNASAGNYDPITHVLTVSNITLSPYGEMSINWTGTVAKEAVVGKSMVTTAYTNYSVPGTTVEDEVTAYVVGSVASSSDAKSDTGSKTVIGASDDRGFLPNSLVEWLALIAILFIIFILGRSLYSSYSTDKKGSH